MDNGYFKVRAFKNEPGLGYNPTGAAKDELLRTIAEMRSGIVDIPLIIGGKEYRTGNTKDCIVPHDKNKVIGRYHEAGETEIKLAIKAANDAKKAWAEMPYDHRMLVFLKAARLASTTWRARLNAATMLCQSKTFYQADIDAACELIDFYNMNCKALCDIYDMQPAPALDSMNKTDYKPLDGFVFAVTPFNFTAIASNLPSAPAIAGNTVVWKPASSTVYAGYVIMKLWQEAGLPDGVINFIPGNARQISGFVLDDEHLAGIHFTGSTAVFNSFYKKIGENIDRYHCYPRIVGETGGKNVPPLPADIFHKAAGKRSKKSWSKKPQPSKWAAPKSSILLSALLLTKRPLIKSKATSTVLKHPPMPKFSAAAAAMTHKASSLNRQLSFQKTYTAKP